MECNVSPVFCKQKLGYLYSKVKQFIGFTTSLLLVHTDVELLSLHFDINHRRQRQLGVGAIITHKKCYGLIIRLFQ